MTRCIGNLSAGRFSRVAWVLAACGLVILASAGFVAPRAFTIQGARRARERAQERILERQAEAAFHERFLRARGAERIAEATARVEAVLPQHVEPMEVFDVLRLVAEARGIRLSGLHVNEPRTLPLEATSDPVMLHEVDLRGRGDLGAWIGMVEDFRQAGYPSAVLEFRFSRENASAVNFDVRMMLGVFQAVPSPSDSPAVPGADS